MSYLVFFGLVILAFCCWGSGTFFAAIALVCALALAGFYKLPGLAVSAAALLIFSGPLAARIATPLLSPLFTTGIPASLRALLVCSGYALVLDSPHSYSFLNALASPGNVVQVTGVLALAADIVVSATIIAALALTFVALIELPFGWVFRGQRAHAVSWLMGMRPVLLVFFIALSLTQVAGYFTDLLSQAPDRVVSVQRTP